VEMERVEPASKSQAQARHSFQDEAWRWGVLCHLGMGRAVSPGDGACCVARAAVSGANEQLRQAAGTDSCRERTGGGSAADPRAERCMGKSTLLDDRSLDRRRNHRPSLRPTEE
jgi:hypothetical protein